MLTPADMPPGYVLVISAPDDLYIEDAANPSLSGTGGCGSGTTDEGVIMTPDDALAAELRDALRGGCTVAQLVRRAIELTGDELSHPRLARVVRQAFGLLPGGWYVLPATESFGTGKVPDSKLTWVFLPEILANRPAWDTDPDREPAWYDGLEKTPLDDMEKVATTTHDITPIGWAALGERDRQQVIFLEKMRLTLGENVQLLAALAERLQRRVNELEQQLPAAVGTGTTEQQPT